MTDGIMLQISDDGKATLYESTYDITIHCESEKEQREVMERLNSMNWIPILDGYGQMPEVDEEGYSDYILLSFRNASFLCIGQYRVDEEGGAFYDGNDENPLTKIGLFVNAWMPLPEKYHDPL